jgi:hypothetical protein
VWLPIDTYFDCIGIDELQMPAGESCMHVNNQYYVGWGTLALINAGLAQSKNRSGMNWFLLSILLGPVATLILLLVEKEPESRFQ